ncbi:efflux RND transporter permease subunit [Bradyrhizobium sp. CCBAU 25338]|uniref:efflux RND transporter permease subunit n=1 Tax=Bradyrhizobium sp. CCBAU 25338 TaxID=1641877 RepID=UPI002302B3D4|nr:efflux RND transporter permease subunit [Bradyrhizobium sp. CCBAU 25338]MDA9526954.1 RND transporter [Bradyrhizobium sp. CCBAU 25338]
MGIVRFALRFPHTFYVLAALILFLGGISVWSMPTDIFPEIRIPVVTVIWSYTGLSTPEMEQRVSTYSQYSISANVSGIKNIEAQTLNGLSVQKIYFQPDVNLDLAISQIVSATNAIRALMPPGIQPPVIVQFNASSVPVLQLSLESDKLNEQQLYDFGIYRIRQQLAPVPGVTLPTPAGGKYRQIMVDIDPNKLSSRGLTPLDIVNAVNTQNLTLPTGTAKIGDTQYTVRTNATPASIKDLNMIPVKFANGATILLKDVAQVRDGSQVQQNIVREDGHRAVLLSVIKNGNASTLAVVNGVKQALKSIRASAPAGLKISELFDQSVFVTHSVDGVLREGAIAAGLTALMILVFLGSWRSTLVVLISIPLAMLSSLIVLHFLGETLNTMTLGGLALAVGILVDDSTVTIENTHRLWTEEGMPLSEATLHGAAEIAVPTLVSTLAISCVFTSVIFLEGPAQYLFTPLGLAVVFAMLASYALSRTLTPITIGLLLKGERRHGEGESSSGMFSRASAAFERSFERLRDGYSELLTTLLRSRSIVPIAAVLVLALGAVMFVYVGRDFYPLIDGGQIQLHVRAPAGTRIERTEAIFQAVEDKIREVIPDRDRGLIVDNIGLPARPYNLAFTDGSTIGVNDGTILVSLKDGHRPTADYVKKLRQVLPAAFPEDVFYFQAADIVTQILNFGLPAQIDVRTVGYGANNLSVAKELQKRLAAIPGVVDAHLQQEVDAPAFYADIDRTRAAQLGLNASTVATNINVSLSSSAQVSPNFWTDPTSGIPYYLAVQTPEYRANSLNALGNTPVSASSAASGQTVPGLLSNVATFKRGTVPTNLNQANVQPVYDVYASVQGRDLGGVSADIGKVTSTLQKQLQPGNSIEVLGQIQSMHQSFRDLGIGLLFAAILVYLLMVVNYQNFGDPLVVIMALPATFCGIMTMLFITGTTLNVPSLMGAIMAVGVASANSILLVTFARDAQLNGHTAFEAALSAGRTRIRPVLMTAAAMIVGMIPMAIGGPGEEQNAALARAVIGGLLFATPTTLLIVPYLFAWLRKRNDGKPHQGVFEELPE